MNTREVALADRGVDTLLAAPPPRVGDEEAIRAGVAVAVRFRDFIAARSYPCVGAKSALARNQMTAYVGTDLTSAWDDVALARQLVGFARDYARHRELFITFVAFFPQTPRLDEEAFEQAIWQRIASLQAKDEWLGQPYDEAVDPDPTSPNFSLSFGGQSFFVVGMHPDASRPARRFEVPAMVFNLHDQFERLRAEGRYEKLRASILARDEQLAGSVNPMLARHGEASEARQYSGRIVGPEWTCPWPGRG
ncbi:guanitoxin biosynthesis heme-dependent pre-guanitoxin N-hydroxylase GntA [Sphingomicrobium astaxanthinifaciens]|uniref:guanitoxin biosynthesis heme-dependent pre-guanitoxin N-hydroxylase GntA n=1 Tax=Sphingomicrobium astaxanthinifaciens TaxID=1227949 RepID=UPI001FCB4EC5|nr:guanitoxin biosynthesis heme-dependent pre-guanitoxin N-hydroxylase GntA [Sphingomicrobium astaxanthinifaciens]MCJ7420487.1 YqcI/YcgG family protein [Sphingomicrobium astaxanthinifaciens]